MLTHMLTRMLMRICMKVAPLKARAVHLELTYYFDSFSNIVFVSSSVNGLIFAMLSRERGCFL